MDDTSLAHSEKESAYILALALLVLGFAGSYFATELFAAPLLWYFPLEHRWELSATPSAGLKMGWYGKVLLSALIGFGLSGLGLTLARLKALPNQVPIFVQMAAMGSTLFALYYFAKSMAYRVI